MRTPRTACTYLNARFRFSVVTSPRAVSSDSILSTACKRLAHSMRPLPRATNSALTRSPLPAARSAATKAIAAPTYGFAPLARWDIRRPLQILCSRRTGSNLRVAVGGIRSVPMLRFARLRWRVCSRATAAHTRAFVDGCAFGHAAATRSQSVISAAVSPALAKMIKQPYAAADAALFIALSNAACSSVFGQARATPERTARTAALGATAVRVFLARFAARSKTTHPGPGAFCGGAIDLNRVRHPSPLLK